MCALCLYKSRLGDCLHLKLFYSISHSCIVCTSERWNKIIESYCGRGGDGPVAFNAQRQSLGFLFWMVTCSFTFYLLISHRMKAGGSVYSFIHSFIKGKCSRRYRKAQEGSGRLRKAPKGSARLRKAPEMNIKHRHKQ